MTLHPTPKPPRIRVLPAPCPPFADSDTVIVDSAPVDTVPIDPVPVDTVPDEPITSMNRVMANGQTLTMAHDATTWASRSIQHQSTSSNAYSTKLNSSSPLTIYSPSLLSSSSPPPSCTMLAPASYASHSPTAPSRHPPRHRLSPRRSPPYRSPSAISSSTVFCALLLAFLPRVLAATVQFQNCLSHSYRDSDPPTLQWNPIRAEAFFSADDPAHNLEVLLYGNVIGSRTQAPLPEPNSEKWNDSSFTDGKILREPEKGQATTLLSTLRFLSYKPYSKSTDFCETSLHNGACPLAPVFPEGDPAKEPSYKYRDDIVISTPFDLNNQYQHLPLVNLSYDLQSGFAFSTISADFVIKYGDAESTRISCASIPITPDLGGHLSKVLAYLPLLVLGSVIFATIFAAVFCPWGTSDLFKWSSNHSREIPDLLRLVTPGFGDCLNYIQFAVLTSCLGLRYPGYYQPVTSRVAWSALLFNHSYVGSHRPWVSVVDGVYVSDSPYALGRLGQFVGLSELHDIWACFMISILYIVAIMIGVVQLSFAARWLYRYLRKIPEEDLRSKNVPFCVGNLVRIMLVYFLLPGATLCTFQLLIAKQSATVPVALAGLTLVLWIAMAVWCLYAILTCTSQSELIDRLDFLLAYGPLYNTYSDRAAAFCLIPLILNFLRGFTIGAAQRSGVAQIAILASLEIITLLTLLYIRPYDRQTSMNLFQAILSGARLITILLMVSFVPSMGVSEGSRGWVGYAILMIHGCVLTFGFFLNALQTVIEVVARLLGAGEHTTGGLADILGMRQLSRRISRRHNSETSRQSFLSTAAVLEHAAKPSANGYAVPDGHVRSESGASLSYLSGSGVAADRGGATGGQRRSSSMLGSIDMGIGVTTPRTFDSPSSHSLLTPVDGSAVPGNRPPKADSTDPYYRPPRPRRREPSSYDTAYYGASGVLASSGLGTDSQRTSRVRLTGSTTGGYDGNSDIEMTASPRSSAALGGATGSSKRRGGREGGRDGEYGLEDDEELPSPMTSTYPITDYSTREVDFYYGVRGPALNSERPVRRLGTGPADPTGPVATAVGWLSNLWTLGGLTKKKKEPSKGFEVIRSTRVPPPQQRRPRPQQGQQGHENEVADGGVSRGMDASRAVVKQDDDAGPESNMDDGLAMKRLSHHRKRHSTPKPPDRGMARDESDDDDEDASSRMLPEDEDSQASAVDAVRKQGNDDQMPRSPTMMSHQQTRQGNTPGIHHNFSLRQPYHARQLSHDVEDTLLSVGNADYDASETAQAYRDFEHGQPPPARTRDSMRDLSFNRDLSLENTSTMVDVDEVDSVNAIEIPRKSSKRKSLPLGSDLIPPFTTETTAPSHSAMTSSNTAPALLTTSPLVDIEIPTSSLLADERVVWLQRQPSEPKKPLTYQLSTSSSQLQHPQPKRLSNIHTKPPVLLGITSTSAPATEISSTDDDTDSHTRSFGSAKSSALEDENQLSQTPFSTSHPSQTPFSTATSTGPYSDEPSFATPTTPAVPVRHDAYGSRLSLDGPPHRRLYRDENDDALSSSRPEPNERPTSFGYVQQRGVQDVTEHVNLDHLEADEAEDMGRVSRQNTIGRQR